MSALGVLDICFLSVLLFCAIDIIRQTNPLRHPFHALGFVAMAIGAAGWVLQDLAGIVPSWYAVLFHAGLAIYSALGAWALWAYNREQENVRDDSESDREPLRATLAVVSTATGRQGRHQKGG